MIAKKPSTRWGVISRQKNGDPGRTEVEMKFTLKSFIIWFGPQQMSNTESENSPGKGRFLLNLACVLHCGRRI